MPEYKLYFTSTAGSAVTIEAESLEDAIDQAYDQLPHSLCAYCSGWNSEHPGVELNDVWELDKGAYKDYPNG